jgi:hypothetical protein
MFEAEEIEVGTAAAGDGGKEAVGPRVIGRIVQPSVGDGVLEVRPAELHPWIGRPHRGSELAVEGGEILGADILPIGLLADVDLANRIAATSQEAELGGGVFRCVVKHAR